MPRKSPALETKFITVSQLRERWAGCSHMFVERKLAHDPDMPKPIRLSEGKYARRFFRLNEIEDYEKLCASRRAS